MKRQWFGIVGRNGSGKSSVCDHFKSRGFYVVSLSDVVRDYVKQMGGGDDRDSLTNQANQLKHQHGFDYFAKQAIVCAQSHDRVIFDSIRHPDEVHLLMKQGTHLMGINVDLRVCYERIQLRKKGTDFVSFDEFKRQDSREMEGESEGQHIQVCLEHCHIHITNNGSLGTLIQCIDTIIDNHTNECIQ